MSIPSFLEDTIPASFKTSRCFDTVDLSSLNRSNICEKECSPVFRRSIIINRTGWDMAFMIFALISASSKVINRIFSYCWLLYQQSNKLSNILKFSKIELCSHSDLFQLCHDFFLIQNPHMSKDFLPLCIEEDQSGKNLNLILPGEILVFIDIDDEDMGFS